MKLPKETVDRLSAAWQRELAYADGVLTSLRRNADSAAAKTVPAQANAHTPEAEK